MMQLTPPASSYAFGRYRADTGRRALLVDGEPARLGARAFDVLTALIERRERVVGKNELLDVVWPHLVVEENNLQVQIWALRRLLGPEVIVTIPGRGYKFAAVLDSDHAAAPAQVTEAAAAPPVPLAAATATNLAPELPPLYGRDTEVQAVKRLLLKHRLVTIAGAGGIGKTRLGLTVAHALRDDFADGVWLIELAPLADPALLPASVAQVLGHQLHSTRKPLDELVGLLEMQRLLLVIDNCEHLVEAVSHLAQALLDRAPDVHLLVTTQEALRLPSEHLYRLDTLGVPDEGEPVSAAQALEHGAVQLFVERVCALNAHFALDEHNVQAVIDICRQLDGLALAIEMAAARVPALGVPGVRERLGERLRLLTAGSRIALRRHQTLRAALDWSHGLLDEQDQVVFRRLGIFSGGCTIEAVQQVACDEQLDEWMVLDAIGHLVDKSLIVADGVDAPRYRMLESARAYALEKLAAARETEVLARRHASHFAMVAERNRQRLFAPEGSKAAFMAARAIEFDNTRAALKWALGEDGDVGLALELLWYPMSMLTVSRGECEATLTALGERLRNVDLSPRQSALQCMTGLTWGFLTAWQSRTSVDALAPWPTAQQRLQPLGERWVAYCGCMWAMLSGLQGKPEAARVVLEDLRRREQPDWPAWLSTYRLSIAVRCAYWAGDPAEQEIAEVPALLERLKRDGAGRGEGVFELSTLLAEARLMRGQWQEGTRQLLALAEQGRQKRNDMFTMLHVFRPLIVALTENDRLDEARGVVLESMPMVRWFSTRADFAPVVALFALRRGRPETAARLTGAGEARRARSGTRLGPIGFHAHQKVRKLLAAAHADDRLSIWFSEGAALTDEDFDRLVAHEA